MAQLFSNWGRKGRKLLRLAKVPVYRRALRHGVAATVEHHQVPFEYDHRTVIDVGAGRGQFAVFARHRFPKAKIYCFEPIPTSFARAVRALADSREVSVNRIAVGRKSDSGTVYVTADFDSSSLFRPTREQAHRFPGTDPVAELAVDVRPLDQLLHTVDGPALLKVDLQGGELEALAGAESLLTQVAEVFIECSFVELYEGQPLAGEIISYMIERDFFLAGIFTATYGDDGTCVQADVLFRRRDNTSAG